MRRWLAVPSGILLLQIIACSPATVRRSPDRFNGQLPSALIVEREIRGTILNLPLKHPAGMALDRNGELYLCDQGNYRVVKFDSALNPVREAGGYGSEEGLFKKPVGIAIDSDSRVFVTDAANRRVVIFDTTLIYRWQLRLEDPDEPLKFGSPAGIAVTERGDIRIADNERHDLICLKSTGEFEKIVGDLGYRGGQLQDPQGLAVDHDDNVLVCDAGNGRLVLYDKYGEFSREMFLEGLVRPVSAYIESERRVWILDQATSQIFICNIDGTAALSQPLTIFGASSPIDNPHSLIITNDGRLIISDQGNDGLLVCRIITE